VRIVAFVVAGSLCFLAALRMLVAARILAEGSTWSVALRPSRSRMVTRTANPSAYWVSAGLTCLYIVIYLVAAAFLLGDIPRQH
jgi:hypothetical protein